MSAPGSLAGQWTNTPKVNAVTLTWPPVMGASGYVVYRSTHPDGPFNWPDDFVMAASETTYTNPNTKRKGKDFNVGLDPSVDFFTR